MIILYDNLYAKKTLTGYALTASSSATVYDVANVSDWLDFDFWKSNTTGVSYVDVSFTNSQSANSFSIYAHDIFTNGGSVKVKRYNGGAWTQVGTGTAQGGASSSLTLIGGVCETNDAYAGKTITITGGAGTGQSRTVVTSRKNQITYSGDLTAWTNAGCTIVGNVVSDTTATNYHYLYRNAQSLDATKTYAFSLQILKDSVPASSRFVLFRAVFYGASTEVYNLSFDTSTGQIVIPDGAAHVIDEGDYWRACIVVKSHAANTTYELYLYPAVGSGATWNNTATGSVAVGGLQVEFDAVTPYIKTLASPAVGVAVDTPWSSNLLTYSNDWSNAAWLLYATASKTGSNQLNFTAVGDKCLQLTGASPANKYVTYQIKLSGTGTVHLHVSNNVDQVFDSSQITLTSTPTIYTGTHLFNATAGNLLFFISRGAGDTATSVTVGNAQVQFSDVMTPYIATGASPVLLPDATSVYDLGLGTSFTPTSNGLKIIKFPQETDTKWRTEITSTPASKIGVAFIGNDLSLPAPNIGFAPPLVASDEVVTNRSAGGALLGISSKPKSADFKSSIELQTPEWIRTYWNPFMIHAARKAFILAWDENALTEAWWCWCEKPLPNASYTHGTYMKAELICKATDGT